MYFRQARRFFCLFFFFFLFSIPGVARNLRREREDDDDEVHGYDQIVFQDAAADIAQPAGVEFEEVNAEAASPGSVHEAIGRVGTFRVATAADIASFLSGVEWSPRDFPDQNGSFNAGALAAGLSSSTRSFLLDHFSKFALCRVCAETPCHHFPSSSPMPDDLLLRVPVVFDESGQPVLSVVVLPGLSIFRDWLLDAKISSSIISEPIARGDPKSLVGNASFCCGSYFAALQQKIPASVLPLCIAAYSDGTTVVSVGVRSCHVASLALLNSSCSTLDTVRPCMFIPKVKEEPVFSSLSNENLKKLKRLIFHASWEVVMQTSGTKFGCGPVMLKSAAASGEFVSVLPVLSVFVGDTPEVNSVMGHRNGSKTALICGRCPAEVRNGAVREEFVLQLNRKAQIDEILSRIAARDDVTGARSELRALSVTENFIFSDTVRHFDAALCCPTCSLHVGRLGFTRTLLETIGHVIKQHDERHSEGLVKSVNGQFRRYFPFMAKGLFSNEGKLCFGMKTGKDLTAILEVLPYLLFNILPLEMSYLIDFSLQWRHCLKMWVRRGKSATELEEFSRLVAKTHDDFVRVHSIAGVRCPLARPIFHSFLHAPQDQVMFGDDCVFSTQSFEKAHGELVKKRFKLDTNKSS